MPSETMNIYVHGLAHSKEPTNMHRPLLFALLVASTVLVAVACSSSPPPATGLCATHGKCPNEGAPTRSDIDGCNANLNGTCGAKFRIYYQCVIDNEKCNSFGDFDPILTLGACATEASDWQACEGGGTDGGADGSNDTGAACGPSNCNGCCSSNVCMAGTAATVCGKGGAACSACPSARICKADQTCGVDPESIWKVQPVSATIGATNNGADWDVGAGAPDPFVQLWCPSTAPSFTHRTLTVTDSYSPTWSSGGCPMKAKDLFATGFGLQAWDEDVSVNDPISGFGKIPVVESDLLAGFKTVSAGTTLVTMKVAFQPQ